MTKINSKKSAFWGNNNHTSYVHYEEVRGECHIFVMLNEEFQRLENEYKKFLKLKNRFKNNADRIAGLFEGRMTWLGAFDMEGVEFDEWKSKIFKEAKTRANAAGDDFKLLDETWRSRGALRREESSILPPYPTATFFFSRVN